MTIGQRIRHIRLARDLAQQALADRAGVGRSTIANIETDRQQVQVPQLIGIARVLDVPIGVLAGTESMPHLPYVAVETQYAVSCSECGNLGHFAEPGQAQKVKREHRCPWGGGS